MFRAEIEDWTELFAHGLGSPSLPSCHCQVPLAETDLRPHLALLSTFASISIGKHKRVYITHDRQEANVERIFG